MRRMVYLLILISGLVLATAPIDAKYKSRGVTTSLQNIMVLIDLSSSLNSKSKIYMDAEGCQCACDNEQWSCIDTNCEMQADACMDDELSYDKMPWQTDDPVT